MNKLLGDGNIIGRLGAILLLAGAGFGLHRLTCSTGEMCAVMKTDSCCPPADGHAKPAKAAAAPSAPAK